MDECSLETEAERLFLKGAELERNNNYYEAIKYYRKAVQLVPDIDVQIFRKAKQNEFKTGQNENNEIRDLKNFSDSDNDIDKEGDGTEPLFDRFQRILGKYGRLFNPKIPTKGLHLSDLPEEIIIYILRWVVSSELDLRGLEHCALVCRGFYLCARNPQIWKSACIRMWKNKEIQLTNYDSWRDMFINRPKIGTNGCYIGETKYYRQGERSFQDENYRPYHLVIYYRYLRFFADGSVLMLNTPDMPSQVVGQLKNKSSKPGAVIAGSYRIVDDMVHIIMKVERIRKHYIKNNLKIQHINLIYDLKLQIKKFKKWQTKLEWKEYKILCPDDVNLEDNFVIHEHLFPSLRFSRVRSYTATSEYPLL